MMERNTAQAMSEVTHLRAQCLLRQRGQSPQRRPHHKTPQRWEVSPSGAPAGGHMAHRTRVPPKNPDSRRKRKRHTKDQQAGFPGGASGKEPPCQRRRCKRLRVRSLGREDPLEEGMAIQSSILSCRIPMDRRAWQVTIHRASELDVSEATQHTHFREGRRDQGSQDSFAVMS